MSDSNILYNYVTEQYFYIHSAMTKMLSSKYGILLDIRIAALHTIDEPGGFLLCLTSLMKDHSNQ